MVDEAECTNTRLAGDLKALNLQKAVLEGQIADAHKVKEKAEGDLKALEKNLEVFKQKKDEENRIKELESEVVELKDSVAAEKLRADCSKKVIFDLEKQRDEYAEDAKGAVSATEGFLKAQLAVLLPEFDISRIGFMKEIVDGNPSCLFLGRVPVNILIEVRRAVLVGLCRFRIVDLGVFELLEGSDQFPFSEA
ncbi:hypothetical protein PIB30_011284 [Stylosanthes scabra]|uniref:Uncharacterized protein n=1 Tax=Stylosanthes scabra TaxID=79078 RepID=A0ABU6V4V2_9FABA|nr:hypothetical protein [Stylosanthes scabra]